MSTIDTKQLRKDADGFKGRFFYDAEHGDLAYIAKDCDDKHCDCEVKTNADGDQDCSVSIGDYDEAVGDPIARMLNRHREMAEQLAAAAQEIRRLQSDEATMKLARMIGLGDPVRPDIHAVVCRKLEKATDELRARRALDLSPQEVEALEWVRRFVNAATHGSTKQAMDGMAVLDKLLAAAKEGSK